MEAKDEKQHHLDISLVVAVDDEWGIGKENKIPWSIPEDMQWFKQLTTPTSDDQHYALLFGYNTYQSLPKAMKEHTNKNRQLVLVDKTGPVKTYSDAIAQLSVQHPNLTKIFVCGGTSLYKEAFYDPMCKTMYITHMYGWYNCDRFFPSDWTTHMWYLSFNLSSLLLYFFMCFSGMLNPLECYPKQKFL
jgi:dihydrofolate reductase